jgi:hypothetical protein
VDAAASRGDVVALGFGRPKMGRPVPPTIAAGLYARRQHDAENALEPRQDWFLRMEHCSADCPDLSLVAVPCKPLDGQCRKGTRRHAVGRRRLFDFRMKFLTDASDRNLSDTFVDTSPDDLFNLHSTILCAVAARQSPEGTSKRA